MRIKVLLCLGVMMFGACNQHPKQDQSHYFLREYDHLTLQNSAGHSVAPSEYIQPVTINGVTKYEIPDPSIMLQYKRSGEPYTGYIRTFHKYRINLEARFKEGQIQRLRYWHGNRTLGMDANFAEGSGTLWNQAGQATVSWNPKETYYLDPATQQVRRIISDTLTSYFSPEGEMTRYSIRTDTSITHYYPDGTPRFLFPMNRSGSLDGKVKRWFPNGEIQVTGQYKNNKESGTWIEYDSLGNEVHRETWQ